jgi:Tfp pilus assembly protein PilN
MTALQNSLYFREWGRVLAACKQHGFPIPERHSLHVKALGQDKSHLDFTNDDFDRVLAEFRALSQPDNLAAQLNLQDQPRRRLLYSIRRLAPEAYWRSIARDKFGTSDETRLDLVQLRQLRITLTARSRSHATLQAATA